MLRAPLPGEKTKTAPSYPKDRTKPIAPWYHLNSWPDMTPCARCPNNGGNPFQPTRAAAGSGGPLTGEVRGEVLQGSLHQPLSLCTSGHAYYPAHRFLMIVHNHTPSNRVCQFLFPEFLLPTASAVFSLSPAAGLPNVYQNQAEALAAQGPFAAGRFRRLPNVYQENFFR